MVAVEDFIDVGNILGKIWVSLSFQNERKPEFEAWVVQQKDHGDLRLSKKNG